MARCIAAGAAAMPIPMCFGPVGWYQGGNPLNNQAQPVNGQVNSTMSDKSGSGLSITQAANTASTVYPGINGQAGLTIPASSAGFTNATPPANWSYNMQPRSFFIVVRLTTATSTQSFMSYGTGSGGLIGIGRYNVMPTSITIDSGGGNQYLSTTTTAISAGNAYIISFTNAANNLNQAIVRINGVQQALSGPYVGASNTQVGPLTVGTAGGTYAFYELIAFNYQLSAEQTLAVESYLNNKYAVF